MTNIRSIIRKGSLLFAIAIMAAAPIGTFANVSADAAPPCVAPADSTYGPGVHHPTGSEAPAFTFQCDVDGNPDRQYAGLWTSAHYIFYPASDSTKPKLPIDYTYNKSTGKYDFSKWAYEPTSNSYHQVNGSTATPPANAHTIGGPEPVAATNNDATGSPVATAATANTAAANTAGVAGSNGSNSLNNTGTANTNVNNNSNATVTNNISGITTTGGALVVGNTSAGSAASGNAVTQADIINMLQSSSNALGSGSKVATFTYNIDGNVNGDLFFDPSLINNVQGDTTVNNSLNNNLVINNKSDATINNDVTLDSVSGNATVAANTTGGDATSGSAQSIANIINSIQSSITAGKSFIGTINITGNLNGDILLPANFVDQLIASNVPTVNVTAPGSTNSNTSTTNNNTTVTNTNNQGISNTVNSSATTGQAKTSGNTSAGSATTGKANTNVTAFNLTGSKVIAKNSILVYVNVLGKWTGLIVNAPAGATAAQLGGNVTQNSTVNNNATVNNTTNQQINNNVNVKATSGDAKVKDNTSAGNAASGDAQTAVNLVNIEGSTFDMSDWFGVLFINVFGTWNGSFGINTSAGDTTGGKGADGTNPNMLVGNVSKLVHYSATSSAAPSTGNGSTTQSSNAASGASGTSIDNGSVLAAQTLAATPTQPKTPQIANSGSRSSLILPAIGVVVGLAILGSERLFTRRKTA